MPLAAQTNVDEPVPHPVNRAQATAMPGSGSGHSHRAEFDKWRNRRSASSARSTNAACDKAVVGSACNVGTAMGVAGDVTASWGRRGDV